jgi:hypothetical protein
MGVARRERHLFAHLCGEPYQSETEQESSVATVYGQFPWNCDETSPETNDREHPL